MRQTDQHRDPPRLSDLKKTAHQMGFVFIDGKLHNVIIDDTARTLTTLLELFRRQVRENQISFDPSTRRLIGACKLIKAGFETMAAFKLSFTATLSPAELDKIQI